MSTGAARASSSGTDGAVSSPRRAASPARMATAIAWSGFASSALPRAARATAGRMSATPARSGSSARSSRAIASAVRRWRRATSSWSGDGASSAASAWPGSLAVAETRRSRIAGNSSMPSACAFTRLSLGSSAGPSAGAGDDARLVATLTRRAPSVSPPRRPAQRRHRRARRPRQDDARRRDALAVRLVPRRTRTSPSECWTRRTSSARRGSRSSRRTRPSGSAARS